jgi:hypothetical protein
MREKEGEDEKKNGERGDGGQMEGAVSGSVSR